MHSMFTTNTLTRVSCLTALLCSELYVYDVVSDVWSCPAWQGTEEPNGRFAHSSCILPPPAAVTAAEATVSADAVANGSSGGSNDSSSEHSAAVAAVQQQTVVVFGGVCPEEQGELPSVTLLSCNGTAA
jgi:hypothetical protein